VSEADGPGSQSPASYTYDAKARVASMTPAGSASASSYGFDESGNLTTLPAGAAGTYDNAGELTGSTLSGATTGFTYNADGQRLTAASGGTTTAAGTWNGARQLTSYASGTGSMTSTAYDGLGMRATATITPAGSSAVTQHYVWNPLASVPQLIMDSGGAYIYAGFTTPAEQVDLTSGTITYLNADSLGSVRGTVSATGTLTGNTSYDAWGTAAASGGLTATTPFGYAGAYTDPTGLIYLINRYYDPATGQFTSSDPLLSQTLQPYAYTAGGNPVSHTDPRGLVDAAMTYGGGGEAPFPEAEDGGGGGNPGGAPPKTGGAAPVRQGQAGEAAVRAVYDIGPKATRPIPGTGRTRVFDGLNDEAVSEVKNVGYQAFTLQLRDDLYYARRTGRDFVLYVRRGATLSKPLEKAIRDNKRFILKDIP
jgi:RHS repeat-associated protein